MKTSFKSILCLVFVFVLGTVFTATPYSYAAGTRPSKVETALWEYMQESDDDKLIPIGIVFYEIDDEALSREIKAQTGMEPEVYRDDELFDAARTAFQREKNRVTKEMISEQVDSFVSEFVIPRKNEVIYAGRYVSSLYIKASKDDILEYAQQTEVQSIFYADLSVRTVTIL